MEADMENAIILAAGAGKRMHSDKPKVLMEVLGKPMLSWVTEACENAGIENICVVKGYGADEIDNYLCGKYETVLQSQRLGTGHAVMCAKEFLSDFLKKNPESHTLVACGDSPFIDFKTIRAALEFHKLSGSAATVITADSPNPYGYGRIVRKGGELSAIIEERDCTPKERKIREINSGCYWFDTEKLLEFLPMLTRENAQGEYYLTDTVALMTSKDLKVTAFKTDNSDAVLGANDRKGLLKLNDIARKRIIERHLENGVEFITTDGITISPDVRIGAGTKILPSTILTGNTVIGNNCIIGPNSRLENTAVGDDSTLDNVVAHDATVGSHVSVGPFVQLRAGTVIKDYAHVGDFVEIKNSVIGEGTAVAHLTYVGDSDVGKNVNFGCGVVTVNYDGTNKARCTIGDNAFIGCNTNLIAPVNIGDCAYTAAGSTVNKNVPDGALAIERSKLEIREGYAEHKLKRHIEKGKELEEKLKD